MEDGKGQLADGTKYLRESGEDFGPNGFWRRWTCLKGVSAAGKVHCACHSSPQHSFPCNRLLGTHVQTAITSISNVASFPGF